MFTLIFHLLIYNNAGWAQAPFAPVQGQFEAKGQFDYVATAANFPPAGGSSKTLANGGKFTTMMGLGQFTYDLSREFRAYGGFSGGQSSAVVVNQTQLQLNGQVVNNTHTNVGLADTWLGGQWWTKLWNFDIVPQADFVYPVSRVNTSTNDPLLGEGAMRMQGGAWVLWNINDFTPFGYGGLAYRDGGQSSLFPYSLGVRYGREKDWWVQAEWRGFMSITNDNADQGLRDILLTKIDGGSYEFYPINPSRSDIAGSAGIRFGDFGIKAGASTSLIGKSSADRLALFVALTWNGFMGGYAPPQDFREQHENYDDQYFKEGTLQPVEDPPAVTPVHKKSVQKARPPRHKAAPKSDESMPNVEKLMKDTEKTLDKKTH